jgi:hypothetical protein
MRRGSSRSLGRGTAMYLLTWQVINPACQAPIGFHFAKETNSYFSFTGSSVPHFAEKRKKSHPNLLRRSPLLCAVQPPRSTPPSRIRVGAAHICAASQASPLGNRGRGSASVCRPGRLRGLCVLGTVGERLEAATLGGSWSERGRKKICARALGCRDGPEQGRRPGFTRWRRARQGRGGGPGRHDLAPVAAPGSFFSFPRIGGAATATAVGTATQHQRTPCSGVDSHAHELARCRGG